MIVLLAFIFAACSPKNAVSPAAGEAAKPIVLMVGYENHPGEPADISMNKWKELLEQRSNGSMRLELYPSSQLGTKNEIMDQAIAGDPVATICDGSFYADRGVPDFGIALGPYLFDNYDECWKLVESNWWQEQVDKLAQNGLQIITANWIYGTRHTLTTFPVRTVADMKNRKIRVAASSIYIKMYEALGTAPVPMPLGEVYIALQQGVIDGQENPLSTIYNGKFHEVAKYLILDGHVLNTTSWVCGTIFWNSLTDAQRELLRSTGDEAGVSHNEIMEEIDSEMLELLKAEGVIVVDPSPAVKEEFRKTAESFYTDPEITKDWSPNLYQTIRAIIKG